MISLVVRGVALLLLFFIPNSLWALSFWGTWSKQIIQVQQQKKLPPLTTTPTNTGSSLPVYQLPKGVIEPIYQVPTMTAINPDLLSLWGTPACTPLGDRGSALPPDFKPSISMNPSGMASIAYKNPGSEQFVAQFCSSLSSCSPVETLHSMSSEERTAGSLQIAMDNAGGAMAMYQPMFLGEAAWYQKNAATAWRRISAPTDFFPGGANLGYCSRGGENWVVWGGTTAWSYRSGSWHGPNTLVIPATGGTSTSAQSWLDADCKLYVAWVARATSGSEIYFSMHDAATGAWSAPLRVATVTESDLNGLNITTNAAADGTSPATALYVAWSGYSETEPTGINISEVNLASRGVSHRYWGSGEIQIYWPKIRVTPEGRGFLVFWSQNSGRSGEPRYVNISSLRDGGWTAPERFSPGNHEGDISLAVDNAGNALATWAHSEEDESTGITKDKIMGKYYRARSGTWSSEQTISDPTYSGYFAKTALQNGKGRVAWVEYEYPATGTRICTLGLQF